MISSLCLNKINAKPIAIRGTEYNNVRGKKGQKQKAKNYESQTPLSLRTHIASLQSLQINFFIIKDISPYTGIILSEIQNA